MDSEDDEAERLEDREHNARLRKALSDRLDASSHALSLHADPSLAVGLVFDIEVLKAQLRGEKVTLSLSPQEYLQVLDAAEYWYHSRHLTYPHPELLADQRAYWKSQIL